MIVSIIVVAFPSPWHVLRGSYNEHFFNLGLSSFSF